ncbi:MAG TPA: histidine phosphatase family protein [Steroidobacteraceae bacterium]
MHWQIILHRRAGMLAAELAAVAFFATVPVSAHSADAAPLSGPQLIERLRAGGCVLVMRHARSPEAAPDVHSAKADNPRRERQLDDAGEADARALGTAMRALHVMIGPIYSSPTYRARETVRLARLGEPQLIEQLSEGKRGMSGSAERSQTAWLRRAVAQAPPAGSNTLIVTHTPNIVSAFSNGTSGIRAGESLIFAPSQGETRLLGRITVDEWRKLTGELTR